MNKSIDILGLNQKAVGNEAEKWRDLEAGIPKEGPLAKEFETVKTQAESLLRRAQFALNDPNGQDIVENQGEKLAELYRQAVDIKSKHAQQSVGNTLGGSPDDLTGAIEERIEHATDILPTADRKAMTAKFKQISTALAVNPADVLGKTQPQGNLFFLPHYGNFGLNMDQIVKAEKFLKDVSEKAAVAPELVSVARNLQAGIDNLKNQFPKQAAHDEWYRKNFGFKMDTEPLRKLGGILGGLISTVGLAQTAFRKEHTLSPATVGWIFATAAFTRPDLFVGGSGQTLNPLASIGTPAMRKAVAQGFKGEEGVQAFEELQTMAKSGKTKAKINTLVESEEPISVAQLGALNNDPTSAFTKIMTKIPAEKRAGVLKTLSENMTTSKKQLTAEMIRTRGVVA